MTPDGKTIPEFASLTRAHGDGVCQALIKQQVEDFQVDEVLGFNPDGAAGHLYLQLQKTGLTTLELAQYLARVTQVPQSAVGYAGMKDKNGICTQWFSLPHDKQYNWQESVIAHPAVVIRDVQRNSRKLRIGSHRENRFQIRLRQLAGDASAVEQKLARCSTAGVPNYFGAQRFGRDGSNFNDAVSYLSGTAEQGVSRGQRALLFSAARAGLFNLCLQQRVRAANWDQALAGEVMNLEGTARFFALADEEINDATIRQRLAALDIHPSGPLVGKDSPKDRYRPGATVKELETEVLQDWSALIDGLARRGVIAGRRSLRLAVRQLEYRWEQADQLTLSFSLGSGGYATAVLHELGSMRE